MVNNYVPRPRPSWFPPDSGWGAPPREVPFTRPAEFPVAPSAAHTNYTITPCTCKCDAKTIESLSATLEHVMEQLNNLTDTVQFIAELVMQDAVAQEIEQAKRNKAADQFGSTVRIVGEGLQPPFYQSRVVECGHGR